MIVIVVEPDEFEKWKEEQQSLLMQDPGLLKYVSDNLLEKAKIKSGLKEDPQKNLGF